MSCNKIFFLRHLKTTNNKLNIISGQSETPILSTPYHSKEDFSQYDKIFCSTSKRCVETIKILSRNRIPNNAVVFDSRIEERNMGLLEGMSKKHCQTIYPYLFHRNYFDPFLTPPNGESYQNFKDRLQNFYNEYLSSGEQGNILICSHNQALKLLRLLILEKEISYQSWEEINFLNGKILKITE